MNVRVESATTQLSKAIEMYCGPVLSGRDSAVFDYCQSLGSVHFGFVDDDFICCWGLIPPTFLSRQAYLWMWAPEPIKHQLVFIRRSQIQVQQMLDRYERIVGHCNVASKSAQRWLQWLGAEFAEPDGGFMSFVIERRG